MKYYKTKQAAKAAVRRNGLQNVKHQVKNVCGFMSGSKYYVHFLCELREDVVEIKSRGFSAELLEEGSINLVL